MRTQTLGLIIEFGLSISFFNLLLDQIEKFGNRRAAAVTEII